MFEDEKQVLSAVNNRFTDKTVLVVGDLILDRYLWGDVERISPESPVPIVRLARENEVAGGAANVAANLANLGVPVSLAGYTGNDPARERLLELLHQDGIDTSLIIGLNNWTTITKTRVISGHQQMLRIDRECPPPISKQDSEPLISSLHAQITSENVGLVLLSDYAKGVLTDSICRDVIALARQAGIPILVDPKGKDYRKYTGATAITPNRSELADACRVPPNQLESLLTAGRELCKGLGLDFLPVTLSAQGIAYIDTEQTLRISALAREVFDVSGAGDTVLAVLAAGLLAGLSRIDALRLANLAAGVVVGKVGTVPVQRKELIKALSTEQALAQSDKICPLPELLQQVENWRARGERLVFTNGCFDLLHAGHVSYLEKAKRLGQRLIVGLNSDSSVKALKGAGRPIIRENDRARVLAALAAVDAVVLFDEETPLSLIRALRPEVLAKGADYTADQVVGGSEVKKWGGEVALVELVNGKSSSLIVQSIQGVRQRQGLTGQDDSNNRGMASA